MSTHLEEVKCPVCGKLFIPAPRHVYHLYHKNRYVCSYHCSLESERRATAKKEKIKGKDGTPCVLVDGRYQIYLDNGCVYDTEGGADVPQYVFYIRDIEMAKVRKRVGDVVTNKHILDATCGSRTIWFQKEHPWTVYMDCREEHGTPIWKSTKNDSVRKIDVHPDVVADFTMMPFQDNTFELVVFDPPHLIKLGESSWLKKKYGKLSDDWPRMIHDGFWECMRVLKPYGVLIFKWNEFDIPTRNVIDAIGVQPLFGHRSGKAMKTHWMCFMKGADSEQRKAD